MANRQTRRAARRDSDPSIDGNRIAIDFLILGDYAQAVQGKLNLIGGGWTLHHARQYPSPLAFGLGFAILVPWSETNRQHGFILVIRKSEGPELLRQEGAYNVGRDVTTPVGMTQRVTLGISGLLQLPEPGTYEVSVSTGAVEKAISFEALQPQPNLPPMM